MWAGRHEHFSAGLARGAARARDAVVEGLDRLSAPAMHVLMMVLAVVTSLATFAATTPAAM